MVFTPWDRESRAAWRTHSMEGPLLRRQYPAFWKRYAQESTYSAVMAWLAPGTRVKMLSPSSWTWM